ncbi:MAG: hypothetical protein IJ115_01770 [Erysipelotrichaceae bacterium]|nr:hypothetical protein [Erysipelotrichaceae bacterium]
MASKVVFKSNTDLPLFTEFTEYKADYLKSEPDVFQNERDGFAIHSLNSVVCEFFVDGQPYYYYRHSDPDKTRWVGICRLGDRPLDYQKGGYTYQLAAHNKNDIIVPYHKLSNDPVSYGFSSEYDEMSVVYTQKGITVKEGDILNFTAEFFPTVTLDHFNAWPNGVNCYVSGKVTGYFEGKPIEGVGRFDRAFCTRTTSEKGFDFDFATLNMNNEFGGIRKDGRREEAVIDITAEGKVWAYYWLEGEEPVSANEVEVEADWYKLPYLNDGTCIYKDIVFRFVGKEIHMNGKWGHKGFTGYPRFDKLGQCEISGPWYEGKEPYEHELYVSFNEVQEAYDHNITKYGFDVFEE